jgi:flagellar protein FlaG
MADVRRELTILPPHMRAEVTTMNISPSDMDVGQGSSSTGTYALASATSAQSRDQNASSQTAAVQQQSAQTSAYDEKSAAAVAAADKMSAQEAAKKLGEQLNFNETGLTIKVLNDSQHTVQVEVVDQKSNKVLRKIPEDELIKLSASIREMTGVILNKPA